MINLWENMKMDRAAGELASKRRLENGKVSSNAGKMKLARSLSEMCLNMTNFQRRGNAVDDTVGSEGDWSYKSHEIQVDYWLVCDECWLYSWLNALPLMRYETNPTASVPKTHAECWTVLVVESSGVDEGMGSGGATGRK